MGGKSRRVREKEFRRTVRGRLLRDGCPRCGERAKHYVPGGFGIPGFFMCTETVVDGVVVAREAVNER